MTFIKMKTEDSMRHKIGFRYDDYIQKLLREIMLNYKDRFDTESQIIRAAIITFHRELMEVKKSESNRTS